MKGLLKKICTLAMAVVMALIIAVPVPVAAADDDEWFLGNIVLLDIHEAGDYCTVSMSYTVDGKTFTGIYDRAKDKHWSSYVHTGSILYDASIKQSFDTPNRVTDATITITPKSGYENKVRTSGWLSRTDVPLSSDMEKSWSNAWYYEKELPDPFISNDTITYHISNFSDVNLFIWLDDLSDEEKTKTGSLNIILPEGCSVSYISNNTLTYGDRVDMIVKLSDDFYKSLNKGNKTSDFLLSGVEVVEARWGWYDYFYPESGKFMQISAVVTGPADKASLELKLIPKWFGSSYWPYTVGQKDTLKVKKNITEWKSSDPSVISVKKTGKKKAEISVNSYSEKPVTITAYSGKGSEKKAVKKFKILVTGYAGLIN